MLDKPAETITALHSHQLVNTLAGAWIAQSLSVVARLEVADVLAKGPQTVEAIASRTGCHAPALYRLLRALASVEIFAERDDLVFELTPKAELLRSDHPHSLRAYAMMMGSEWVWNSWTDLEFSVKSGKAAFDKVFGVPVFEYYAGNLDAARCSSEGLGSRGQRENKLVVEAFDFSRASSIVDIGGGQGGLLAEIICNNPHSRGILFDRPPVIEAARSTWPAKDADRIDFISGDFFQEIPSGIDVYLMKKVLHDWNDEQAGEILRICRAAIPDDGCLLIIDQIVPIGNQPSYAKLLDLLMLVLTGGRERTQAEHERLLATAKFRMISIKPLMSSLCLIEAKPEC